MNLYFYLKLPILLKIEKCTIKFKLVFSIELGPRAERKSGASTRGDMLDMLAEALKEGDEKQDKEVPGRNSIE